MSLSLIGKSISVSATLKLNEKAALLKAQGEPVIHLGGGEPKSKAPIDAILGAVGSINTGETRYTPATGIPELKQAIIGYTEEFYHKQVSSQNVIASNGAKQAIMVALQAILNPKDELVYPAPYWVSYPEMAKLVGAVSVAVHPADGSFYPKIQDFERVVNTSTKCIIINSPSNPSGAMYSEEFISDIVKFCEKKDLWLIMDDIYHRLIFDGKKPISCFDYAKDFDDNSKIIVINGVSKQYAMTGYRIGWAIGNKKLIEVMKNIQSHQTSGPSIVVQRASIGALNGMQSCVESLRLTLENNRNVLMEHLKTLDKIKCSKPDGTFYCFPDFSEYAQAFGNDSAKLADYLLEKVKVVVVPGSEFGMKDGCHVRISTCGTIKDITEGIERIRWALDPNSSNEYYIGGNKILKETI